MPAYAFTTPPGGILTRQAGAITGPVELDVPDSGKVRVRYAEADEWYTVSGRRGRLSPAEVVALLSRDPGPGGDGNPAPSRLR